MIFKNKALQVKQYEAPIFRISFSDPQINVGVSLHDIINTTDFPMRAQSKIETRPSDRWTIGHGVMLNLAFM